MSTALRHVAVVVSSVALALTATACGGDPNIDLPGKKRPRETVIVTSTVGGQIDQSAIGGGEAASAPSQSQAQASVPGCDRDTNLSDTAFGPFGWTKKVMVPQNGGAKFSDGRAFHFTIAQNQFDACQPLSWITLEGTNGDIARPSGTGASAAQAVVFFLGDQMVSQPMPVEVHTIEAVTRTGPDAVTVGYGVATGSTVQGVTEQYTVGYAAQGGRLVERSSTFPAGQREQYLELDLAAGAVPMDAAKTPLGNAHSR